MSFLDKNPGRLLSIEPEKMTVEALTTITADDVDMPEKKPARREKHIGFGQQDDETLA